MIKFTKNPPAVKAHCAEAVKINSAREMYSDIALFWVQNNGDSIIGMLDGNMVIYNNAADTDELREFVSVIAPKTVFSDSDTLSALFGDAFHTVCVMQSDANYISDLQSDRLCSKEIYNLLDVDGLSLPPYEFFAVDFCHRLNHGGLDYFAIKDSCCAVCISGGETVLINGIASHSKGMGTAALNGVLSKYTGKTFLAVCEKDLCDFYLKNNFKLSYLAGYWGTSL